VVAPLERRRHIGDSPLASGVRSDGGDTVRTRKATRALAGWGALALFLAAGASGCGPSAGSAARGREIFAACVACHGPDGEGNRQIGAPNIAGLPRWYVENQLQQFLSGHRGSAAADTTGRLMATAVAPLLKKADDVASVAAYVSGLPARRPAATLPPGDTVQGKVDYQPCATCHKADGTGKLDVPPVTLQADWYLLAELHKYKNSWRGTNEGDLQASRMRAVSIPLSEKQMRDVVTYIGTLASR
jgi:cytochrome c oxidase subunit 2